MKLSDHVIDVFATIAKIIVGLVLAFLLFAGLLMFSNCVSFGHFATAEDQAKWNMHPCEIRGPNYDQICDDDWTDEGAADICPCRPAMLIDKISPTSANDAGVKDANVACDTHGDPYCECIDGHVACEDHK